MNSRNRSWERPLVGMSVVLVASALVLAGCGTPGSDSKVVESNTSEPQAQTAAVTTTSHGISAMPAGQLGAVGGEQKAKPALASEDVAPDLDIAYSDTLVTPGQLLEIGVKGTADVSTVTLSDGLHSPQAFVADSASGLWKVQYRVPLNNKQDRYGLSITARNAANHWCRVWVFLHVKGDDDDQGDAID